MSATSLAGTSREPHVENGGVSPEQGGVLHDGEIFQLELDALLPASRRSIADHSVKVEPPAIRGDSEFQTKFVGPTSEPVPLRPPRPAPYVVMPLSMGPQDCWGNLLGKSRR